MAYITLYVPSTTVPGERVFALWKVRAYIASELGPNILLGMDTLVPQGVLLDIAARAMVQLMCEGVTAPLIVEPKDDAARKTRKLTTLETVTIPLNSAMKVKVYASHPLSLNYDYMLEVPKDLPYAARPYAMLLNSRLMEAIVRNDTRNPVKIHRRAPLGLAVPLDVDGVYALDQEDHAFAAMPDLDTMPRLETRFETKSDAGITVYGEPAKVSALLAVAERYPEIWIDRGGFARIPEDQWMPINLRDGWQEQNMPSKIYPVGPEDRDIIDATFDKLADCNKMERATRMGFFPVPVFVVKRKIVEEKNGIKAIKKKGRPVLDMRNINHWVIKDCYPLTT
ncbi:unnamed protein product [Alternaria burnsii]|nr:unnamed protein product [Alternaria burnsii]